IQGVQASIPRYSIATFYAHRGEKPNFSVGAWLLYALYFGENRFFCVNHFKTKLLALFCQI
ncbi:MAG: hypothetical protein PUP92_37265, partial [Rhizonema sp. PD38]|nr:hypothetical protein [Rhizonema sp. PD38]